MNFLSSMRTELVLLGALWAKADYLNVGIATGAIDLRLRDAQQEAYRMLYGSLGRLISRHRETTASSTRVLEIGCGLSAAIKDRLWPANIDHEAIDCSRLAVSISRRRGVNARLEDIRFQSAPSNTYDAVIGVECLCAIPMPMRQEALNEISRVLVPSGLLITLDYFPVASTDLLFHLTRSLEPTNLDLLDLTNLTDLARDAVDRTEAERAAIFTSLPKAIRRSAFGQGLRETLSLKGSKRYSDWIEGRRSYALMILRKAN